jgi:ATP-binding cassette subfamily D (ALD) protein 3
VDSVFLKRIKYLLGIVIPSWKCIEVMDLTLLTLFLVLRTFLSIYLAGVNGRIVKAIIEMDLTLFIRRILGLGLISVPASFVNSFLDFLNRRLAINFRRRLTHHFHKAYLKDMIFYQLSNLDSRVSNPDQRLTSDIDKWATSLSMIYSNFSKPLLDIILFSRKLAELVGWGAPIVVGMWYGLSGLFIKVVSPPFGRLIAIEQRLEGSYRESHTDLVHHAEEIAFYRGNNWERERIDRCFNVSILGFLESYES